MRLHDYLKPESLRLGLEAREKNEAIAELAETLRGHPDVADYEEFLGAVYAREMSGTTGIGDCIAIPHARTDSVRRFVAALGVSAEGVEFQAADGKPVSLMILMGIPTAEVKAYLRLLARLSLLLKQPQFVERVVTARSPEDVIDALAEHEA
jgi:PTS system fructose-specific IIC component